MAVGSATLDFGAAPGANSEASVAVAGQTEILAVSQVEAFVRIVATADHTIDEARFEQIKITAGNIVEGTGFTIYGEVLKGRAWGQFTIEWVWV